MSFGEFIIIILVLVTVACWGAAIGAAKPETWHSTLPAFTRGLQRALCMPKVSWHL